MFILKQLSQVSISVGNISKIRLTQKPKLNMDNIQTSITALCVVHHKGNLYGRVIAMNRSMLRQTIRVSDIMKNMVILKANSLQGKSPKGHLSRAEGATLNRATKPTIRSYTASDVIRTLVLSATLVTRRVTAIERIFPDIISSAMMAMKQVRSAMRAGDRPTASMDVVFIFTVNIVKVCASNPIFKISVLVVEPFPTVSLTSVPGSSL